MCYLCWEIQKETLTVREVAQAYREVVYLNEDNAKHSMDILKEIAEHYDIQEFSENMWELRKKTQDLA